MSVKVHNVRFYDLEPKSINVMVCEESLNLLALARSDNSIEVWNLSHSPYIERTFVGTCGTVEDLAWFNKRLFSGGLQGSVIEHDLCSQTAKRFHPVTSGACWCIAVEKNRKQLAAGTEDGYINIIDISDDDMVYNRLLDRQEGRILCLKWDSTGNQIVTGSVDTVRVWNVQTGHAIHRMNTGRAADNAPTIVWSLDVTKDLTIATGDSRGMLCLWDGKTGMSLTTFHSHKADILSVCFDDTQQTVYCAGIDPLIVSFEKLKMRRGETKWAQGPHRSIHDHDVRCLNFCNGKLYSAGVDSYLAMSSFPPKLLLKFPPLLQPPTVSIADDMLILLRYPAHLELWRLASCRDETPVQLLRWQPPSEYHIKCAQISKDSKWLACSTLDRFRLYSIHYEEGVPKLKVVRVNNCKTSLAAHRVCFSGDSMTLIVVTISSSVRVIELSHEELTAKVLYSYHPLNDKDMTDSILHLTVSKDGTYTAAADTDSNIVVWSQGEVYAKLPTYKCAPTAMLIQPVTNCLIIVYADHRITEYALESGCLSDLTESFRKGKLAKTWMSRNFSINGISFDPSRKTAIILHDDSTLYVLTKGKSHRSVDYSTKRAKWEEDYWSSDDSEVQVRDPQPKKIMVNIKIVKKNKHLVHFGSLCKGEMVAVEVGPLSLSEKLPLPSLHQKRFGKM